jgi:4-hydroxy-4-methyl-2-oxoglutarate aldolase
MQNRLGDSVFEVMKEKLYTAVICDALDILGYRNQALREDLRPLELDKVIVGRAKTILAADVYHVHENPYEVEIDAIDSIKQGDIVMVGTNDSKRNGIWGELLTTVALNNGANGAVIDGLIRDTKRIRELGFPVYCKGIKPVDSKGRGIVIDYDCPLEIGGVMVKNGDIVFGDCDGVAVIPAEILEDTLKIALERVDGEDHSRKELMEGKTLRQVFEKYGVL